MLTAGIIIGSVGVYMCVVGRVMGWVVDKLAAFLTALVWPVALPIMLGFVSSKGKLPRAVIIKK